MMSRSAAFRRLPAAHRLKAALPAHQNQCGRPLGPICLKGLPDLPGSLPVASKALNQASRKVARWYLGIGLEQATQAIVVAIAVVSIGPAGAHRNPQPP